MKKKNHKYLILESENLTLQTLKKIVFKWDLYHISSVILRSLIINQNMMVIIIIMQKARGSSLQEHPMSYECSGIKENSEVGKIQPTSWNMVIYMRIQQHKNQCCGAGAVLFSRMEAGAGCRVFKNGQKVGSRNFLEWIMKNRKKSEIINLFNLIIVLKDKTMSFGCIAVL